MVLSTSKQHYFHEPLDCPRIMAEVCGNDNATYLNNCYLEKESCKNAEKKLKAKAIGKCLAPDEIQVQVREAHQANRRPRPRPRPGQPG